VHPREIFGIFLNDSLEYLSKCWTNGNISEVEMLENMEFLKSVPHVTAEIVYTDNTKNLTSEN